MFYFIRYDKTIQRVFFSLDFTISPFEALCRKLKIRNSKWLFATAGFCVLVFIVIAVGLYNRINRSTAYNVLLISFDALRADSLNCYGFKGTVTSPNIDALARDSILFENCITASPWTTPSHMSMLTSLYPSSHGITFSFSELWDDLYSNETLKFVKLHQDRTTLAEVLKTDSFTTGAFTGGGTLEPEIGFGRGFDLYDTSMYKLNKHNMKAMFDWIEYNSRHRFFLFWHNFEVHAPYLHGDVLSEILPEELADILKAEHEKLTAIPLRNIWPFGNTNLLKTQQELLIRQNAFSQMVCTALYLGGVGYADQWLGQLIKKLREKDLYDNTIIIFTSDHGEEFGDHGQTDFYDSHGHSLYEEMLKVPLIIKLPYQQYAGTRISKLSRLIDIMPTVLDLLSITPSENEMQGISLVPLWMKNIFLPPQTAYSEALAFQEEKKSLRTDRYKLIISIDSNSVSEYGRKYIPKELVIREFYDILEDPNEKNNLLNLPQNKGIVEMADEFEKNIRKHISGQTGRVEEIQLDKTVIEKLKGLGYIGE